MNETKTGVDVIRERVVASNKRLNLARFQQEVGITSAQFDAFVSGKTIPSAAILQAMVKYLWAHATFDPVANELLSGSADKPTSLPSLPTRAALDPNWTPTEYTTPGLHPAKKPKPQGKPLTRPGWRFAGGGNWNWNT